jgi:hypothetical protein
MIKDYGDDGYSRNPSLPSGLCIPANHYTPFYSIRRRSNAVN